MRQLPSLSQPSEDTTMSSIPSFSYMTSSESVAPLAHQTAKTVDVTSKLEIAAKQGMSPVMT